MAGAMSPVDELLVGELPTVAAVRAGVRAAARRAPARRRRGRAAARRRVAMRASGGRVADVDDRKVALSFLFRTPHSPKVMLTSPGRARRKPVMRGAGWASFWICTAIVVASDATRGAGWTS